jgi:hypothetical protein
MTQGAGQGPDQGPPAWRGTDPDGASALTDLYAPTVRDLPVMQGAGPLYVVGDVHGYLDELRAALREAGLTDAGDSWAAGNTRLWFLGDFTDRGPDGIGVIEMVMRLSAEAAAAGGYCKAILGNHELLLLGASRFGDAPVESAAGTASFQAAWLLNGGQRSDMERLQDHHVQWMSRLDSMALTDGHLLVHSDTTAYLDFGSSIDDVNDAIWQALQRNDVTETWDLFRKFTKRFAFRDEDGPQAVRELLETYGGKRVVHGHSPIPYLTGGEAGRTPDSASGSASGSASDAAASDAVTAASEAATPKVQGPHVYADSLAIAMDGGVTMSGRLLVARLPLPD